MGGKSNTVERILSLLAELLFKITHCVRTAEILDVRGRGKNGGLVMK